jgi:hypothetical protein
MQGRIVSGKEKREERELCIGAENEEPVDVRIAGDEPLIEISDRDYRSICWPCCALEEGDCKSKP